MGRAAAGLAGHLRTLGRYFGDSVWPPAPPAAEPWRGDVEDRVRGRVPVTGRFTPAPAAAGDTLAVLVHGIGGDADSRYLASAARGAQQLGLASLRLNLRGSDPVAGDLYHAGLTAELHAAVAHPAFAAFRRIVVMGYSLGGHLVLRFAAESEDPRVAAVGAVCAPLDLAAASSAFERPACAPYRAYVMRRLRGIYRRLEQAGAPLPNPYRVVRQARTLRQWDELTVVPRFGFRDPDDYYARASAAPVVDRLRVPALLLAAERDPMVPPAAIRPFEPAAVSGAPLTVEWHPTAGHVAFPGRLRLGVAGPPGLEPQLLARLLALGEGARAA